MTTFSEKLADLSVCVGDIEARVITFKNSQEALRSQKVSELKSDVKARLQDLERRIQGAGDEVSTIWSGINQSLKEKAQRVQLLTGSKKQAVDARRAEHRAQRLECNALLAIDFAALAVEEAEIATSEAIDVRLHASDISAGQHDQAHGAV